MLDCLRVIRQAMEFKLFGPMSKVFIDKAPTETCALPFTGFQNETVSFQAAYRETDAAAMRGGYFKLNIVSDIKEHIRARRVMNVPVLLPTYPNADDNYLRKTPGLYPDLLLDLTQTELHIVHGQWTSIWFDVENAPAGAHDIKLELVQNDSVIAELNVSVEIYPAELPAQRLIYTRWFHCDSLCHTYHVDMWSEEFWAIAENYIRTAANRGINMIITPIHTPPLDTAIGGERLTCQLVDIEHTETGYKFGFTRLYRWVELCRKCGIKYFEMAHLFSQWGAKCAPKFEVLENGKVTKPFGWNVSATGPEYSAFVAEYLPAVTAELTKLGIADNCFFHISDEPSPEHIDGYLAAKALVKPYLKGFRLIDALSSIEFYKSGAVEKPIPANNHIKDFLDAEVPDLWTYYCCGQYIDVSNQFIAMPSARTRIMGIQMFKYDIEGFLQWGYNFYQSQQSLHSIVPFGNTDADGSFPAGDPFQVYPGEDGQPLESLRIMIFQQALNDLRALQWLADLRGRDYALNLIKDELRVHDYHRLTFYEYPQDGDFILGLRRRVDNEIIRSINEA